MARETGHGYLGSSFGVWTDSERPGFKQEVRIELSGYAARMNLLEPSSLGRTFAHGADGGGAGEFHGDGALHADSPFGECEARCLGPRLRGPSIRAVPVSVELGNPNHIVRRLSKALALVLPKTCDPCGHERVEFVVTASVALAKKRSFEILRCP